MSWVRTNSLFGFPTPSPCQPLQLSRGHSKEKLWTHKTKRISIKSGLSPRSPRNISLRKNHHPRDHVEKVLITKKAPSRLLGHLTDWAHGQAFHRQTAESLFLSLQSLLANWDERWQAGLRSCRVWLSWRVPEQLRPLRPQHYTMFLVAICPPVEQTRSFGNAPDEASYQNSDL